MSTIANWSSKSNGQNFVINFTDLFISSRFLNVVPWISFWSFYSPISDLCVGTEESHEVDVGRDPWKLSAPSSLLRAAAARAHVQDSA